METIVEGRIAAVGDGRITLDVAGQRVAVAPGQGRVGDRVWLCVRPEDVTLGVPGELVFSSCDNRLTGIVTRLLPSGTQVRALVDCGFPLVALVTHRTIDEMGMVEGMPGVASFKASAAHVIPQP